MIQKILKHKFQIFLVVLAIIGFAVIRNYEEFMFYDPLLSFFQRDYSSQPLPEVIEWKLLLNLFWRYFLNTILSVFIIFVLFKNKGFVKLSTFLYIVFFVILMLLFVVVFYFFGDKVMVLFYIRRFLIQPLFLLLFVPGFYFQQYDLKKPKA
ncbi:exosortase F system-associated membrane protein [Flavobacterium sp. SM2513]|uniref:exosortase F system-associated membrane protein n=1 Tax=Flavobacterium sp. SM2513 TaxID=3424766 RepID=UPI003D7F2CD4